MPRILYIAVALVVPCLSACQVVATAGRGMIDPVVIDHTIELGDVPATGCMPLEEVIETDHAERALVTVTPMESACEVSVAVDRAELIDAAQAQALSEQLAQYDMSAVVAIEVVVDHLRLVDENDREIELGELGDMVLRVDGTRVYDRSVLQSPYEQRIAVPEITQARLLDAIGTGRALHAEIELVVTGPLERELPRSLRLDAQLQPIVHVDVAGVL